MAVIETVQGPIAPEALGFTLIHEHIMCDFVGARDTGSHRWVRDRVVATMAPHLHALRDRGVTGFIDCSTMCLGRDPLILLRLSLLTGLHILTNTGLYKEPYLPQEVFNMSAQALADRWVTEWREGIEGTGIRPGLIKIAVNPGRLLPVQRMIVRAAAIAHQSTGLLVVAHTGDAVAARESLDIIEAEGMSPSRYVIVHADQIPEPEVHVELAERGAWLEYDAIGTRPIDDHVALVSRMLEWGFEDQLLLSQDAGWFEVGEPNGGVVRPYTTIVDEFIPRLMDTGVDDNQVYKLFVQNPREALAVG
jgi:phosphotriesterase-related protein